MGKKIPFDEAKKFHMGRERSARVRDEKTWSKDIAYDYKWKKNPKKYDYPNIDTPQSSDTEIKRRIAEMNERKRIRYARTVLLGRTSKYDEKKRANTKSTQPFKGWQSPTKGLEKTPIITQYNAISSNYGNPRNKEELLKDTSLKSFIPKNLVNESDILQTKRDFIRSAQKEIRALEKTQVYTDEKEYKKNVDELVRKHRFISAHIEKKEDEILGSFEKSKRGTREPTYDTDKLRSLDRKIIYRNKKIEEMGKKKQQIRNEIAKLEEEGKTLTDSQKKVVESKIAKIDTRLKQYMMELSPLFAEHSALQRERINERRSRYTIRLSPKDVATPQGKKAEDYLKELDEKVKEGNVYTFRKMTEGLTDDEKEVFRMFRNIYRRKLLYIPANKKGFEDMRGKYPKSAQAFDIWVQQKERGEARESLPLYLRKPTSVDKPESVGKVPPMFKEPTTKDVMQKLLNEIQNIKKDIKTKSFSSGSGYAPSPTPQQGTPSSDNIDAPAPAPYVRTALDKASSGQSYTGNVRGSLMQEIRQLRSQLNEVEDEAGDVSRVMKSEFTKEQRELRKTFTHEQKEAFRKLQALQRVRFRSKNPTAVNSAKKDILKMLPTVAPEVRSLFIGWEKNIRNVKEFDDTVKAEMEKANQLIEAKAKFYREEKEQKEREKEARRVKFEEQLQKSKELVDELGYD